MNTKAVKEFKNPSGGFRYEGGFSVELTENTPVVVFSTPDVRIEGDRIIVPRGRVYQGIGAIQFFADERPFAIGYKYIKVVRDLDGNPIWVNNNYR